MNFELFPIYFFFFKKKKTKYQQQHHHQLAMLKQSHLQEVPDLFSLVFLTIYFYKKFKNNIEAINYFQIRRQINTKPFMCTNFTNRNSQQWINALLYIHFLKQKKENEHDFFF